MSTGDIKVGELYVAVGYAVDRASATKVEKETKKLGERLEKAVEVQVRPHGGTWKARRHEMAKEAALWKSEQIRRQRIHERSAIQSAGRIRRGVAAAGGGAKKAFGAGLGMVGGMGGLAALGAGMGAVGIAKDALAFDEGLTRLDVASGGAMGTTDAVRERLLAVSKATGVAKESLLEGAASFVALTGDGKAASQALETFARVQRATGASMSDISASAASLTQQLGIGAGEYERAFSILVAGGKAGKVELRDMAALMAPLSASFKQFGSSQGTAGLATLSGAFQVTARNFGSASEASTGLESLMTAVIQNSAKLKKAGVEVFGEDGALRSLPEIVDALAGKGFDATKVINLLGRREAYAAFQALRDNRQEWERIGQASRNANDIAADYARVQASASARLKMAWNSLQVSIAEAFDPDRVEAFVAALSGAIDMASALISILGRPTILGDKVTDLATQTRKTIEGAFSFGRGNRGTISGGFHALGAEALGWNRPGPITGALDTARGLVTGAEGSGRVLDPTFFDPRVEEPFRYEPPAGGGNNITIGGANITVTAPAGADANEIGRVVDEKIRAANDRLARDVAAVGGGQ